MSLSDKELALLKNRLQMPLIIRDMLEAGKMLCDDENYAMHEMLSNFSTEEALLCSAFVMKEIAYFISDASSGSASTDLVFLNMECERLIERYSTRVDLMQESPDILFELDNNILEVIYEDICDFLELIELCQLSFEIINPKLVGFLKIMTLQLQSHMMIVDEAISILSNKKDNGNVFSIMTSGADIDNVIMFPVQPLVR